MTSRRTLRSRRRHAWARWSWLALLGALLGSVGPGAMLASVAFLDGGHAHSIALERDAGHADIVLCHDRAEAVRSELPQLRARDCEDDHRVHVARADARVVRLDGQAPPASGVAIAAPASLAASVRLPMREVRADFDAALDAANRRHRTIVLRL